MDEYERAAAEFSALIHSVPVGKYDTELNPATENPDCKSIQQICFHVLFAGYNYANSIRRKFEIEVSSPERFLPEQSTFDNVINAMLVYTDKTLTDLYSMKDEELNEIIIPIRWSDHHDLEALMEHAIVHILRHRRQVEKLMQT